MARPDSIRDVLVALLPETRDLVIAQECRWYRIRSHEMARRIKGGLKQFKHLAFYQPDSFKAERRCIRYFAEIYGIESVPRIQLLPDEPDHPLANQLYLKFSVGELKELPRPIPSARGRRILFIPTNWKKIEYADDINDLFAGSPIEDDLYRRLRDDGLLPEREYYVQVNDPTNQRKKFDYCLDLAIFCKTRNLDIECDGDTWHARRETIRTDNERDNLLRSNLWQVHRFNNVQIRDHPEGTMTIIRESVNKYGGVLQRDHILRTFDPTGHLTPGQSELIFPRNSGC